MKIITDRNEEFIFNIEKVLFIEKDGNYLVFHFGDDLYRSVYFEDLDRAYDKIINFACEIDTDDNEEEIDKKVMETWLCF